MDKCLILLDDCIVSDQDLQPLPFSALRYCDAPFIYENPKRWTWMSEAGPDYYNLWICRSGHARFRFAGQKESSEIKPWTVLVMPPGIGYNGWNEVDCPGFKNFSAHWMPVGVDQFSRVFQPTVAVLREIDTAEALIQSILRVSAYGDDFGMRQAEWLLLALLGLVWRELQVPWDSSADEVILRQIGRIRSGEGLFQDVQAMAGEAHLSRAHYTRRFKRAVGSTPNAFLVRQRVERCAILLKQTDWTLDQIAHTVGYSEQHFFSRQFSRVMGRSPGAFRAGR
jgi:AraC-like DNA-binding protein